MLWAKALGGLRQSWGRFPALARLRSPWGSSPEVSLFDAFDTFQSHSRSPPGLLMAILVFSRTIHLQFIMAKVCMSWLTLTAFNPFSIHGTSKLDTMHGTPKA